MYTIHYKKEKYQPDSSNGEMVKKIVDEEIHAYSPEEKESYLQSINQSYAQYGKVSYSFDSQALKTYIGEKLGSARDEALAAGFSVNGVEYGFNTTDQTNMAETLNIFNAKILQALQKGESIEDIKLPYKAKSIGEMTLRTFDEFMEIVDGATLHKISIWNHYTQKMIELSESITEKEILAVQW